MEGWLECNEDLAPDVHEHPAIMLQLPSRHSEAEQAVERQVEDFAHAPVVQVKFDALPEETHTALQENQRWLAQCRKRTREVTRGRGLECKWKALTYIFELYLAQAAASEVALAEHEALRSWAPQDAAAACAVGGELGGAAAGGAAAPKAVWRR